MPESPYDVIKMNKEFGLHTLVLLDINMEKDSKTVSRFMTANEGIHHLLDMGKKRKDGVFTEDTLIVGCARLGAEDALIKAGKAKDILKTDFGGPLHCLIVPGELHFKEEEMLRS